MKSYSHPLAAPAGLALAATALAMISASASFGQASAPRARITIEADKPGAAISPTLYGIFFEEINRAGDGGIYAEMLQNRSFEDAPFPLGWKLIDNNGSADVALDRTLALNPQNPTSLRVHMPGSGRARLASYGFRGAPQLPKDRPAEWMPKFQKATGGIAVKAGEKYDLSFYARSGEGFTGPVTVALEREDGKVLASRDIAKIGSAWTKSSVTLAPTGTDSAARLVISADGPGSLWLDMVSLFPKETYKGRPNGLRPDLMAMIEGLKPSFVRFPGGCFVEGDRIENAFRWKQTIGDVSQRPGHWNLWGYRSTDGLGYHEYLQMCEDLGAEPLFVVNCGMSHGQAGLNSFAVPMDKMSEYVQDALDAIEYANGPATSKWGALRAKAGHPKPFKLRLLQIGNENGGPAYEERYALFHDAIKARHPEIKLVACDWGGVPKGRPLDIIDPHLYSDSETMQNQADRFDRYPRDGAKVYFGEYAVTNGAGTGNLNAALGEAAFMTGFERNADVVTMTSYAPLLSHIDWKAWNPNAIVYDQSRVYGTPSYHVQSLFATNRADRILPVRVEQPQVTLPTPKGVIGLATWRTQAEFKDVVVTRGGQRLFASDFSRGLSGWKTARGAWSAANGVLRQTGREEGARVTVGDPAWSDYTLSLKARKTGGDEGFLIMFQSPGDDTKSWWNLGGWENTAHALEAPGVPSVRMPGRIETGRWYDIRIELQGQNIRCFLDGKLVQEGTRRTPPALFASAGKADKSGEVIVKVVNTSDRTVETTLDLRGMRGQLRGKAFVLGSGDKSAENSFGSPSKIAPREETLKAGKGDLVRTFPAHSVTVLRLR